MYCPQCGASNPDGVSACSACGAVLGAGQAGSQETGPAPVPQAPTYQQPYQPPYQQPAYQAPQYQARAPYAGTVPNIPSYLGWAIAVLILCFWPTGIAAVVYAARVNNRLAIGDVPGAQEASRKAKTWCWVSFIIAIVWVVIVIIAVVAAGATVSS